MNEHFILSITARQQRLVSRQSGYLPNITTIFRRVNRLERQPNLELLLDIDHTLELSHHLHLIPHPDFYRYRVPYFPLPLFITPLVFARENPKQSCAAFDIPPKNKMDGLITVKRYYRTSTQPLTLPKNTTHPAYNSPPPPEGSRPHQAEQARTPQSCVPSTAWTLENPCCYGLSLSRPSTIFYRPGRPGYRSRWHLSQPRPHRPILPYGCSGVFVLVFHAPPVPVGRGWMM